MGGADSKNESCHHIFPSTCANQDQSAWFITRVRFFIAPRPSPPGLYTKLTQQGVMLIAFSLSERRTPFNRDSSLSLTISEALSVASDIERGARSWDRRNPTAFRPQPELSDRYVSKIDICGENSLALCRQPRWEAKSNPWKIPAAGIRWKETVQPFSTTKQAGSCLTPPVYR